MGFIMAGNGKPDRGPKGCGLGGVIASAFYCLWVALLRINFMNKLNKFKKDTKHINVKYQILDFKIILNDTG